MSPLPSAPPLELLMEDGFFDDELKSDDPPTCNAPPLRDKGGPDQMPLAKALVIAMPVCEAVQKMGPTPGQDGENKDAQSGWLVKYGKFMMIGVASLVLVALGALIGVVVMFTKQDDTVASSTSSTAIMTSTTSTAILTSTTSIATTTSASSTSSTTSPKIYTMSDKSTDNRHLTPSPFDTYICLPVQTPGRVLKSEAIGSGNRRGRS